MSSRRRRPQKRSGGSQPQTAAALAHAHAQHSHSHSHDGHACHGHGGHGDPAGRSGGAGGEEEEMLKEAQHYCEVLNHFNSYATHSFVRFKRVEDDFEKIPQHFRDMLPHWDKKMQEVKQRVVKNFDFIKAIVSQREIFMNPNIDYEAVMQGVGPLDEERMSRVRSTIKQCVRDWSAEGEAERKQCYGPILAELERLYPEEKDRGSIGVLTPGSGLGRLTWEIARRGFASQGNEFSYYMLLASYLILNCSDGVNLHEIFPYVLETKNLFSVDDQMRGYKIPDVNPSRLPKHSKFSMVAGDFLEIFAEQRASWDVVATCFFIDTANNVLEYMRQLADMIKPGGYWINLGPLLYHFADLPRERSIELSYEEIKALLPQFGFELIQEQRDLQCTYVGSQSSLMQTVYHCVFFTARRLDRPIQLGKPPASSSSISSSSSPSSTTPATTAAATTAATAAAEGKKLESMTSTTAAASTMSDEPAAISGAGGTTTTTTTAAAALSGPELTASGLTRAGP